MEAITASYTGRWYPAIISIIIAVFVSGLPEATAASSRARSSSRISTQEFLAGPFAASFKARNYPQALNALDALLNTYPDDPLILRYRARVLARLGRTDEAITLYRRLLSNDPHHAPTRIFLGQAYLQRQQPKAAAEQWRWVVQHSASKPYRQWAQAQLHRLRVAGKRVAAP